MSRQQPEAELMRAIQLALAPHADLKLWRNNIGQGWIGDAKRYDKTAKVTVHPGDVVIRHARPLHAGLQEGSGDLIGRKTITITADMIGRRVAVFTSLEIKTPDGNFKDTAQINWLNQTLRAGGFAGMISTPDEALRIVGL